MASLFGSLQKNLREHSKLAIAKGYRSLSKLSVYFRQPIKKKQTRLVIACPCTI